MPEKAGTAAGQPGRIGGFELLATLGKGGMGTVYKARQVSMDRVVALKVLPPHLAKNQDFVQRFLREARSAAQLNHPNIVQGIDVGEADGVYYFAMEFVDGPTLKDLLKREGRVEEKKALNIIGGVARALEHAHKHGIVHRDIKPDNVMISREGIVKLADLGLAKSFLPEASRLREGKPGDAGYRDTVTLDGTALGTPHYMAPEQARGDADIDTRADIYALGATFYHMVTGEFPFTAPTPAAVMAKHLTEPAPNPKEKNPALSRPVCDLIQFMMAKEREARPQTPTELLAEVRDTLEGKVKLHRRHSSPLPPGEGRVRAAGTAPSHRVIHAPARKGLGILPWVGIAVLGVGVVGWVLFKPRGGDTGPKVSDHQGVETKGFEKVETPPPTPVPNASPEQELQAELAALRTACLAAADKDQFGKAIEQIDTFTKKSTSDAASGEAAKLRDQVLTRADARYAEILLAVNDALAQKDYPKARAALKPAESFGVEAIAAEAQKRLTEIGSREKSAAEWAKWDEIKASVKKLTDAGQLDDAAKALEPAKALKLDNIAELVQEQTDAIADARQKAVDAVVAAYAQESDKVWALFKERKYAEADTLLAALAAKPGFRPAAEAWAADAEAAKLLKEFWAAVGRGLAAKKGQPIVLAGAAGTLLDVQDGIATIQAPGAETKRPISLMGAKQAAALADLKKDDPHSALLKGVFLLSQAEAPEAEKALATATETPALARYKDRLNRLLTEARGVAEVKDADSREAAGRQAWRALLVAAKGDLTAAQAKHALGLLEAFEEKLSTTKVAESLRDERAALRPRLEAPAEGWTELFDGKTVDGWRVLSERQFAGHGRVHAKKGALLLEAGNDETGIARTGQTPTVDYEMCWEAARMQGSGNFADLVFPVSGSFCALVMGGAGNILALHGVDGKGADTSETQNRISFEEGRWFSVRLRVTRARIEVWIDGVKKIDQATASHSISAVGPNDPRAGLTFTTWRTTGGLRNIRLRRLGPGAEQHGEPPKPGKWQSLFDGKTLEGWKSVCFELGVAEWQRNGLGADPKVAEGRVLLESGRLMRGIACERTVPKIDYEVAVEAMRVEGDGCFCLLVFPVGDSQCSLGISGWDGSVVGLDSVDGKTGNGNITTRVVPFQNRRWYRIRLAVRKEGVQAWVDDRKVIDVPAQGHSFGLHPAFGLLRPLGVASAKCTSAIRSLTIRRLDAKTE